MSRLAGVYSVAACALVPWLPSTAEVATPMNAPESSTARAPIQIPPRTMCSNPVPSGYSIDGERIPYVQVGPAGETGDAPVLMSGYGGFAVASTPFYSASVGKLWLGRAASM